MVRTAPPTGTNINWEGSPFKHLGQVTSDLL